MKKTIIALAMAFASASAIANVQLKGTLTSVDGEQGTFTIEASESSTLHTFEFKDSTLVQRDGRQYRDMEALRVGDEVTYRLKAPAADVSYMDATVKTIDTASKTITFIDTEGESHTLAYREGARVDAGHKRFMKIEHLREGDQVQLEVQKSFKFDDSLALAR